MRREACVKGKSKGSREGMGAASCPHHPQSLKKTAHRRCGLSTSPVQDLGPHMGVMDSPRHCAQQEICRAHFRSHHEVGDSFQCGQYLLPLFYQKGRAGEGRSHHGGNAFHISIHSKNTGYMPKQCQINVPRSSEAQDPLPHTWNVLGLQRILKKRTYPSIPYLAQMEGDQD